MAPWKPPLIVIAIVVPIVAGILTAGPEAHPDPGKRYISVIVGGVAYVLLGLASPLAAALIVAAPTMAIKAVAGLALITIAAGFGLRERMYRWIGLVILAFALGRVVIDVWNAVPPAGPLTQGAK